MSIPAIETITADRPVVVIGGGIAGLSTAWYLQQQGIPYTLLEVADRWGGKVLTEVVDAGLPQPFIIEGGPDSFLTQKPWAWQLAHELGLAGQILGTNDAGRKVFIANKGRLLPMPDGILLIVPTKFMPFALSPLLSLPGKLRMAMDLFIKPKLDGEDETLAEFIKRRLGAEALDKLAEPLMSGIYNAEAEKQSLLATFPRFRALEEKYGSLTRGMLVSRRAGRKGDDGHTPSGPRPAAMFVSLTGGTQVLVDTLAENLTGDLRLGAGASEIVKDQTGYKVTLASGEQLHASAVILATPAYVTAELVESLAPDAAGKLAAIRYVSTGTISLGFRADEFERPLNGFGLMIPRSENRPINAITWTSTKFDHRAPDGCVLLRVFFGGSRRPEMMEKSDEEVLQTARSELAALMGVKADPLFHRIHRWMRANPQYDAGHLQYVDAIEAALPDGIYVTGSPYRGIGLPDCVKQAQDTANRVAAGLQVTA